MVAAHRPKPLDRQEVCRKATSLLKKAYAGEIPRRELPVLETLLYAICLENVPVARAEAVYAKLHNSFHDLNEVRVSSITELLPVFEELPEPDWRALRVKSTLQHVFETHYAFEFEALKRKTADLAAKQLAKIQSLSYFVRAYVLQHSLGTHMLPVDDAMLAALSWLGLADAGATTEAAAEALRSCIRKSDAPQFCHLIHALATDPRRMRAFSSAGKAADRAGDPIERLQTLLKRGDRPASRPSGGKAAAKPAKKGGAKSAGKNGRHPSASSRNRVGAKKRH